MSSAILLISILIMLAVGVPIGISLGAGILILIAVDPVTSIEFVVSKMYSGVADFPLIALPFFMLAGALMEGGGLSRRLVNFADSLVGNITGGLGVVTVLACMFFGAISGSAPATVAAMGTVMIPQMVRQGYDKAYATALVAVSGGLGVIVPPSFIYVLYGVTVDESIGNLFLAGIGPSIVVGGILILFNFYYSKKKGYKGSGHCFSIKRTIKAFWDSKWAMVMPIIILGGIYGGIFTPTEAAVVAVVYGIFIGKFVYKELKWKKIIRDYKENTAFFAAMMLTFAPAAALGPVFSYLGIPEAIQTFVYGASQNPYLILTLIFIVLLPVGMFISPPVVIIVLAPILLPIVKNLGINPVHFGIFLTINLCIAFVTPPFAVNLFVAAQMSGISVDRIARVATPFIIALGIATLIVGFIPDISLGLLRLIGIAP